MLSTLEEIRFTIACTCEGESCLPAAVSTSTEALGLSVSFVKTSFSGIARCTTAADTPSMPSMVLLSSPSSARR
jgi:hypothetical protein